MVQNLVLLLPFMENGLSLELQKRTLEEIPIKVKCIYSISGDYIIVGAPQKVRFNTTATGNGKVYIFQYNGMTWSEIDIVTDPIGQFDDQFGYSVDTDSFNKAIGAPGADPNGINDKGKVSLGPVDE